MTDSYNVGYSVDALGDLREIYSYIANELLVPETAAAQLWRIRKEVRSLDFMPARYHLYGNVFFVSDEKSVSCGNTSVMTEAASIRFNAPKLFQEEDA